MNPTNPTPPNPDDDLKKVIARIESYNDILAAYCDANPKSNPASVNHDEVRRNIMAGLRSDVDAMLNAKFIRWKETEAAAMVRQIRTLWKIFSLFTIIATICFIGAGVWGWKLWQDRAKLAQQIELTRRELSEVSDRQAILLRDWQRILKTHSTQGRRP